jgi:mannose-6-phosphate isomerase-like protein (cupin superfamily)
MTIARWLLLVALSVATSGCASTPEADDSSDSPPAVLDAQLGGQRVTESFESLAERVTLAPGEDFRVALIGRDEHHSQHVVAIRTAEVPHRHDEHDLLVMMLSGHGKLLMGSDVQPVGPGSILYIPRRTRHAFSNESGEPAIAYAIYTPPFDGKDRVVDE